MRLSYPGQLYNEKSYAQMCLIAALWNNMTPPFRFSSHYYSTYKGKFTLGRLVLRHHHLYTAK